MLMSSNFISYTLFKSEVQLEIHQVEVIGIPRGGAEYDTDDYRSLIAGCSSLTNMHVCIYLSIYECMYVCMYVSIYLSIYVRVYVCMYVCVFLYHIKITNLAEPTLEEEHPLLVVTVVCFRWCCPSVS